MHVASSPDYSQFFNVLKNWVLKNWEWPGEEAVSSEHAQ